jgi:hypothetical protein
MLKFKDKTVRLDNLRPQMVLGLIVMRDALAEHGYDCIVTSCNDGHHSYTSLHYAGSAVDVRSKHIASNEEKQLVLVEARKALPRHFDLILESLGTPNEHYHMEYQPKND